MDYKNTGGNFRGLVAMFIILTVVMASQLYTCVKTQTAQLKYVQFMIQLCLQVAKNVGMQRAKNIPRIRRDNLLCQHLLCSQCNEDSVVLAHGQANRAKELTETLLYTNTWFVIHVVLRSRKGLIFFQ